MSRKTSRLNSLDIFVQKDSTHQTGSEYLPHRGVVCVKAFTAAICSDVSGGQPREDEVSSVLETSLHRYDDATRT